MEPVIYDGWRIVRGDSANLGIALLGRNVLTQDVVPLPLDAADVVEWAIRWPGAADPEVRKSGAGGQISADAEGVYRWPLTPEQTDALAAGQGRTRVRILYADGRVQPYLRGRITVETIDV